jgi:hypothetical protein
MAWYSDLTIELHSNENIDVYTELIINESSAILNRDDNTVHFKISKTEGTWSDPRQDGMLLYRVTYQDKPGKITLKRNGQELIATIDFTEITPEAMKQVIVINRFETL